MTTDPTGIKKELSVDVHNSPHDLQRLYAEFKKLHLRWRAL